jgi:hypothetical protein
MSEVSAQLRQIRLRQITSKIITRLYRKGSILDTHALHGAVENILADLDQWRNSFPLLMPARNAYETLQWRELNYYRERLKCFRPLVLAKHDYALETSKTYLDSCQQAVEEVAFLYQAMRASEKLVLNWTCVHDMMSAGFTLLYCGLVRQEIARRGESMGVSTDEQSTRIWTTTEIIMDTLSHIARRWRTVEKHVQVFKALADRVADSLQSATSEASRVGPRATNIIYSPGGYWDGQAGHQAEMWDAAVVAFLNEPLDLGNIDWGAVDWDAVELSSIDQT